MYEEFVKLTHKKYRFPAVNGMLTAEQLADLPLRGKVSLNAIAIEINKCIRQAESENFVDDSTPSQADDLARLEIVKAFIKLKMDKAAANEKRKAKKALRDKIEGSLQESEDRELLSKSPEELRKMLKALEEDED